MPEPIICAFAADDAYCPHMATAIVSLAASNARHQLQVMVLQSDLQPGNISKLEGLLHSLPNVTGRIVQVDASGIADFPITNYSLAAYLRIFMPDVLPSEDKVLYLDSDLLVLSDIADLWNVGLDGALIAAAPDAAANIEGRLKLDAGTIAFNSGVMLMDLAAWRCEGTSVRALDFIKANPELIKLVDQDALNVILQGRVKLLDYGWNYQPWPFLKPTKIPTRPLAEMRRDKPHIVHFAYKWKPWRFADDSFFEREYLLYRNRTPWAPFVQPDRTPKARIARVRRRVRRRIRAMRRLLPSRD